MEGTANGQRPGGGDLTKEVEAHTGASAVEYTDLEAMGHAIDEDLLKLKQLTEESETHEGADIANDDGGTDSDTGEVDRRSVYVGNVDYGSTPQELQDHFRACGQINRITIMVDRFTGHPKGFAYVEFADADSVKHAEVLNETIFRGRQIKVTPKRKNVPGHTRGTGRGRGRGGFSTRGRGHYMPRGPYGYSPRYRGRFMRPRGPY
eukprot:Platyproteum_vivax@DN15069_c0_g1_i1.p1